ncbi:hypothetical protein EOPP23_19790 [Endozoicomonas sp. OPT23]|uniref:hypothetical protein n=1 Tax=Endozoicomonas sp. OPT23 TaxID=2072845 RepID=UPI00129A5EB0|nr:hypothetical protein [Endozoicomonas sp. OPT23]MRI35214.1 hypothetical protein [Endozoicomonas sp. OPT23]
MAISIPALHGSSREVFEAVAGVGQSASELLRQGRRKVSALKQKAQGKMLKFAGEHPVAVQRLKKAGCYLIRAVETTRQGVVVLTQGVAALRDRVGHKVDCAKRYIETRNPILAKTAHTIFQFAVHPLAAAVKGGCTGLGVWVAGMLTVGVAMEPLILPLVIGGLVAGAGIGLTKAVVNSVRYVVDLDGAKKRPVLAKALSLYDRVAARVRKFDNYLENLTPALAISYKFVKEMSKGCVRGLTLLVGGGFGAALLDDYLRTPFYGCCYNSASFAVVNAMVGLTLAGAFMVGPGFALWNTAKFARDKLCKVVEPVEVLKQGLVGENDLGVMV